jgi:ArsR family transcriptional regulator
MEQLLNSLRAAAEPTRLRLLALAARAAFCVMEFTEILGQSQPRLSRHLKLLCDCGLLDRIREGGNGWFALPTGDTGALPRELVARLRADDPILEADRRQAARALAERARIACESFRQKGADWDEMRALDLPAQAVEQALLALIPANTRLVHIGSDTGQVLELLAPRVRQALGIDASKAMLALARARLYGPGFAHTAVRLADMYRLPLADNSFDTVVLEMVLPHAEDPEGPITEATRVLTPGGTLLLSDRAVHDRTDITEKLAHRWPSFSDATINRMFATSCTECETPSPSKANFRSASGPPSAPWRPPKPRPANSLSESHHDPPPSARCPA